MTNEQAAWLKKNPQYRPVGIPPAFHSYRYRKWLMPDGTILQPKQAAVINHSVGDAFQVGILTDTRGVAPSG